MPASMAAALARNERKVDPRVERYAGLQKDIHDRLIEYLDLRRLDMDRLGDEELWRRTEKAIRDILDQMEADGSSRTTSTGRSCSPTCSTRRSGWGRWRRSSPTMTSARSW